ncbi:MAG TPA: hypothetical protein VI932_11915 [Bacteroidota bacterium]|nr:hypothetical protein [Bacteroidota bacterium]
MRRGFPIIIILLAGLISSCERSVDTPRDIDYTRPYLHDLQIFPEAFNTDTILVNGEANPQDLISLSLNCIVIVDVVPGSAPATVRYSVTLPVEDRLYAEGTLSNNDISPQPIAGGGIYAGTVTFTIRRVDIGDFQLSVEGFHDPASLSNVVRRQIEIFRSSRAPAISNLSAPDTVDLPPPGQVSLILMSVAAADSDGLGDIRDVFFRNLDSPTDTLKKFSLSDDGHPTGVSGDSIANDGIFSIIVQLPSGTPAATYRFLFEAVDRSGLASNTILHPLTILGPE